MREGTQFYRCTLCTHPVSTWEIKSGEGCPKCGCLKVKPSNLSFIEMISQIIKHPSLLWRDET